MTNHDNMNPTVFAKDGAVYANSRDVAGFFEKRHDHILRDIGTLVTQEPGCAPNFGETSSRVSMPNGGSRLVPSYNISRDGFTLLAMAFTGHKALKFKLAYIEAFNAMERALKERDEEFDIIAQTPEAEARMLVGEARRSFGPKAAQQLWGKLGLPVVPAMLMPEPQMEMSFTVALTAANSNGRLAA